MYEFIVELSVIIGLKGKGKKSLDLATRTTLASKGGLTFEAASLKAFASKVMAA
jgi:hypothetical protein